MGEQADQRPGYPPRRKNKFLNPETEKLWVPKYELHPSGGPYTVVSQREQKWILDFLEQKEFDATPGWVSGFIDRERSYMYKKKGTACIIVSNQNCRELHLLLRFRNYLTNGDPNGGSLVIKNRKLESISFEWYSTRSPSKFYQCIYPQLGRLELFGQKKREHEAFMRCVEEINTNANFVGQNIQDMHANIVRNFNHPSCPQPSLEWVGGFTDADGGISLKKTELQPYLGYSQVDLRALNAVENALGRGERGVNKHRLATNIQNYLRYSRNRCYQVLRNRHQWNCHRRYLLIIMDIVNFVGNYRESYEYLDFVKKSEIVPIPRQRMVLHARKRLGITLPTQIDEILEEHYPLSIEVEYKNSLQAFYTQRKLHPGYETQKNLFRIEKVHTFPTNFFETSKKIFQKTFFLFIKQNINSPLFLKILKKIIEFFWKLFCFIYKKIGSNPIL